MPDHDTNRQKRDNQAPQENAAITSYDNWRMPPLDYPSFRLSLVAKMLDRLSAQHLARHSSLTNAEWRVLFRLVQMPTGLTVKDLSAHALVDRAEVCRAANALEARGLLVRCPNVADRRAPLMFATRAGHDTYAPLMKERALFHEAVTATLTDDERAMFDKLLTKIADHLPALAGTESAGEGL